MGNSVADYSLQERTRLIIEGATAYGVVKAMFVPRILVSLLLTPWFARVFVEPVVRLLGKVVGLFKSPNKAPLTQKKVEDLDNKDINDIKEKEDKK